MSVIHLAIQCLIAHWSNPSNSFYDSLLFIHLTMFIGQPIEWPSVQKSIQSSNLFQQQVLHLCLPMHTLFINLTNGPPFCFAFFPSTQVLILPTHTQILLPIHSPTHKHLGNYLDISYAITHPAIIQMWVLHQLCIKLCFMYGGQERSNFLEAFFQVIKWEIILSCFVPSSRNTKTK